MSGQKQKKPDTGSKKSRLGNDPFSWIKDTKNQKVPKGIELSEIIYVSPVELDDNPLNKEFFTIDAVDYLDKLEQDINERGVIVPVIAKKNNMLLSGHIRNMIAKKVKHEKIPVQYVMNDLSPRQEAEFLIKDNLLRRQLSPQDRLKLYCRLYEKFEERILQENRGGDQLHGKENEEASKPEKSGLLFAEPLTAKKIAADTGQKISTVEKDLSNMRKNIKQAKGIPLKNSTPDKTRPPTPSEILYAQKKNDKKGIVDWKSDIHKKELVIFFEDTDTQNFVHAGIRNFLKENKVPFTRGKL